jgi:hypothetical protein
MKILQRIGDRCAEDHGGGAIVVDEYGPHVEYTYGLESEHPGNNCYRDEVGELVLEVYRVQLDEPAWDILGPHGDAMKLWEGVAESAGQDFHETVALAKSKDPLKIAGALEMYAGQWGWRNLDHEPLKLTYDEVEKRWESCL